MESAIKSALPDVTEEDIASADQDIENPLAMMYAAKHKDEMKAYSERQYSADSYPGANVFLGENSETRSHVHKHHRMKKHHH